LIQSLRQDFSLKFLVLPLFAGLMAITWLLPNHYPPWATFHMDAWVAALLLVAAWMVLLRVPRITVSGLPLLVVGLAVVTMLQWCFGLVLLQGTAWIGAIYLLGFAFVFLLGSEWKKVEPNQAAHGLFLAIAIAAFVSVGMQLHQWLQLDELDIWSMGPALGRPFANFGQPNQLSTFLLWGVLAIAWGYLNKLFRPWIAVMAIAFLLFGIALTQSRTAWIGLGLLVLASWYWRQNWPNRKLPWIMLGLSLYFVACMSAIKVVNRIFDLNATLILDEAARVSTRLRLDAWAMFIDAALQQPWFGYGMNQVRMAHMTVAPYHPDMHSVFAQAHNLFLDLVLWFGIPLGLLCTVYLLRWLWRYGRAIVRAEDAVLLMVVVIVGNHAMLELPLHYAYFLLPTGLILGILNTRVSVAPSKISFQLPRMMLIGLLCGLSFLFIVVVRDYFRIEDSYRSLRFELANFKYQVRGKEPDVILLTDWRDYIRMVRMDPMKPLSEAELVWVRNVVSVLPSPGGFYKLAAALALQNKPQEAQLWLMRLCKMESKDQCDGVRSDWQLKALEHPELLSVDWIPITNRR
jgi:hypothetical protein